MEREKRHIIDSTGLIAISDCVDPADLMDTFGALTSLLEKGMLIFPKSVVDDLAIWAREEPVAFWAQGSSPLLRNFAPMITHTSWVVRRIQVEMGYDEGVEDSSGEDPSIIHVMSLGRRCATESSPFCIVSNENGEVPLRPSASQLCQHFGWEMLTMRAYMESCEKLRDFLN